MPGPPTGLFHISAAGDAPSKANSALSCSALAVRNPTGSRTQQEADHSRQAHIISLLDQPSGFPTSTRHSLRMSPSMHKSDNVLPLLKPSSGSVLHPEQKPNSSEWPSRPGPSFLPAPSPAWSFTPLLNRARPLSGALSTDTHLANSFNFFKSWLKCHRL